MIDEPYFRQKAEQLLDELSALLLNQNRLLVTAESCTGGWIAEIATSRAGSSAWFDRAYVTYSNQAKQDMLGVSAQTLEQYGAVSEQTVAEMLGGALSGLAKSAITVAVSGIAGPGGGSQEKPVGTVFIGWLVPDREPVIRRYRFDGDRQQVRMQTVLEALNGVVVESRKS